MTKKCPYCQSTIRVKTNVEGAEWEWCSDCEYKTNTYYYPSSDKIREIKEVAPKGSVLLVADDGTVEGSGHFDQEMTEKGIEQTDAKYVLECSETQSFEMSIDDPNQIKNVDEIDFDRVIQNV